MARTQCSKHHYSPQDYNFVLESPRAVRRTVITSAALRPCVPQMASGMMLVRQGDLYGRHASAAGEWRLHAAESLHVATLKHTAATPFHLYLNA